MTRTTRFVLPAVVSISLFAGIGTAYAGIGTDRPSFSAAAAVVEPGQLQIETGAALTFIDDVELTLPQALFRVPLTDQLEFRLGLPSLSVGETNSLSGSTNLELKFAAVIGDSISAGVLTYVGLPSGDNAFFGDASFAGRALLDIALGPVTITNNAELAIVTRDEVGKGPRQGRFSYSFMVGWGFMENWAMFGEGYTVYEPSMTEAELNFDGGLIFTPTENTSLDLNFGVPTGDTDATYVGVGFSIAGP